MLHIIPSREVKVKGEDHMGHLKFLVCPLLAFGG